MKKILAVSTRSTAVSYEVRDSLSQDWQSFFKNVLPDFAWVMLANSPDNIRLLCKQDIFSGIILSGGDSIGEYEERDLSETLLLDYAVKNSLPVIGICRGAQMINWYFGGQTAAVNADIHVAKRHQIKCVSSISQETMQNVNSYHQFGINPSLLAKPLIPFAFAAEDNSIEAFYHCALPVYGIMWHPEREKEITPFDRTFFQKILRK